MKIGERLQTVSRIFLDTAPVIYYIEDDVRYAALMERVFEQIEGNALTVVTSPVTLAECLVLPYRQNQSQIVDAFTDLIVAGENTLFVRIDQETAKRAMERHRLQERITVNPKISGGKPVIRGLSALDVGTGAILAFSGHRMARRL